MRNIDVGTEPAGPSAEVSTGTVWHYTDAAGLMGILEKRELWASSALHMNDTTELNLGVSRVEEAFDEAVHAVAHATQHLLDHLTSSAPPKDREAEAAKARARSAVRFATV